MEKVTLRSIDPKKNRNRFYAIEFASTSKSIKVYQRWGRGAKMRQKKESLFQDIGTAMNYIHSLLLRRRSHKYRLSHISQNFPQIEVLETFETFHHQYKQLSLF